jgi:hypothetical protein
MLAKLWTEDDEEVWINPAQVCWVKDRKPHCGSEIAFADGSRLEVSTSGLELAELRTGDFTSVYIPALGRRFAVNLRYVRLIDEGPEDTRVELVGEGGRITAFHVPDREREILTGAEVFEERGISAAPSSPEKAA